MSGESLTLLNSIGDKRIRPCVPNTWSFSSYPRKLGMRCGNNFCHLIANLGSKEDSINIILCMGRKDRIRAGATASPPQWQLHHCIYNQTSLL